MAGLGGQRSVEQRCSSIADVQPSASRSATSLHWPSRHKISEREKLGRGRLAGRSSDSRDFGRTSSSVCIEGGSGAQADYSAWISTWVAVASRTVARIRVEHALLMTTPIAAAYANVVTDWNEQNNRPRPV